MNTAEMPVGPFNTSQPLTMGVELELQLLNLSDFDLTTACGDLLELLSRKAFAGTETHELAQGISK
jgi:carboxylate-amine ligase